MKKQRENGSTSETSEDGVECNNNLDISKELNGKILPQFSKDGTVEVKGKVAYDTGEWVEQRLWEVWVGCRKVAGRKLEGKGAT